MYRYSEGTITKEDVFKSFDQEEIVEKLITGEPVITYKKIHSVFKIDKNPSCYFYWFNNKLWFVDYADNPTHRDVINMIQDKYKLNYHSALDLISRSVTMSRVETDSHTQYKKVCQEITFKSRNFNAKDAEYWSEYGITRQQLMDDKVFPVVWYKFFSVRAERQLIIRPEDICYAYTDFSTGKVKIYRPLTTNSAFKWITNCTEQDIGNISSINETGETLLIVKSYKDCRVVLNTELIEDVIWFQNEGMMPSDAVLMDLCNSFERIIILYDNDTAGIKAAIKVSDYINSLVPEKSFPKHTPLSLNSKDPAELYKSDKEKLYNFLKEIL